MRRLHSVARSAARMLLPAKSSAGRPDRSPGWTLRVTRVGALGGREIVRASFREVVRAHCFEDRWTHQNKCVHAEPTRGGVFTDQDEASTVHRIWSRMFESKVQGSDWRKCCIAFPTVQLVILMAREEQSTFDNQTSVPRQITSGDADAQERHRYALINRVQGRPAETACGRGGLH